MSHVTPLPSAGEVFLDPRGSGRALRVSWHAGRGQGSDGPGQGGAGQDLVVLSLWSGGTCTGSFRLAAEDVPALVNVLRRGLVRSDAHQTVPREADGGLTG